MTIMISCSNHPTTYINQDHISDIFLSDSSRGSRFLETKSRYCTNQYSHRGSKGYDKDGQRRLPPVQIASRIWDHFGKGRCHPRHSKIQRWSKRGPYGRQEIEGTSPNLENLLLLQGHGPQHHRLLQTVSGQVSRRTERLNARNLILNHVKNDA